MSETVPKDNLEGATIDDRWLIVSKLGSGSTSKVYLARDQLIERSVALKIMNEKATPGGKNYKRFSREIKNVSSLSHENLIKLHCVGFYKSRPYMIMDYIEGQTLDSAIAAEALELDRVVSIAVQITNALTEAHSKGIIHRDIKPGNVYLVESDRPDKSDIVKLIDFGMSRLQEEILRDTQSTSLCGTPNYMSPEQCQGKNVDQRADIYSVGCLLYELVTGQPPFVGDTSFETLHKHIHEPVPMITDCAYPGLTDIIMRCLEKRPVDRFQSAQDLRKDLLLCHSQRFSYRRPILLGMDAGRAVLVAFSVMAVVLAGTLMYLDVRTNKSRPPKVRETPKKKELPQASIVSAGEKARTLLSDAQQDSMRGDTAKSIPKLQSALKLLNEKHVLYSQDLAAVKKNVLWCLLNDQERLQHNEEIIQTSNQFLNADSVSQSAEQEAMAYFKRGTAKERLHRNSQAQSDLLKAETLFVSANKYLAAAHSTCLAGQCAGAQNKYQEQLTLLTRCASYFNREKIEVVALFPILAMCEQQAQPYLVQQNWPLALKIYRISQLMLSRIERSKNTVEPAKVHDMILRLGVARILNAEKQSDESLRVYKSILKTLAGKNTAFELDIKGQALYERGWIIHTKGLLEPALSDMAESMRIFDHLHKYDLAARSSAAIGDCLESAGRPSSTWVKAADQALALIRKDKANPAPHANYLYRLGLVSCRAKQYKKSIDALTEGEQLSRRIGDKALQQSCLDAIKNTRAREAAETAATAGAPSQPTPATAGQPAAATAGQSSQPVPAITAPPSNPPATNPGN